MNLQETFDKMVIGLASQGWKQCVDDHGICVYRGPENMKCAIGHLLPDIKGIDWNNYRSINGYVTRSISPLPFTETQRQEMGKALGVELKVGSTEIDAMFLLAAQSAHDSAPDNVRGNFVRLADQYDLKFPPGC